MSPLPSPASVAHTPVLLPVGSGHSGFCGSGLVAVKYVGNFGAGAAGAGGVAGAPAAGASGTPPGGAASSATTGREPNVQAITNRMHEMSVINLNLFMLTLSSPY